MSIIPGPPPGYPRNQQEQQQQQMPYPRPRSSMQQYPSASIQRPYDSRGFQIAPQQQQPQAVYRQSQPPPQRAPSYPQQQQQQPAYPYQSTHQQYPAYQQPLQRPPSEYNSPAPQQQQQRPPPVHPSRPQSAVYQPQQQHVQPQIQSRPLSYHGPGMQRIPSAQNIPGLQNIHNPQGYQQQQRPPPVQRPPGNRPTSSQSYTRPVPAPPAHNQIAPPPRPQSQVHPVPSGPSSARSYGPGTWTPQEVLYPDINRNIVQPPPPQQPVYPGQPQYSNGPPQPTYSHSIPTPARSYTSPATYASPAASHNPSHFPPPRATSPFGVRAPSPGLFGPAPFSTSQDALAFESKVQGPVRAVSPGVHVRPLSPNPSQYARAPSPIPGNFPPNTSHVNSRPLPTPAAATVARSNTSIGPTRDRPQSAHVQSRSQDIGFGNSAAGRSPNGVGLGLQFTKSQATPIQPLSHTPVKSFTTPANARSFNQKEKDVDQTPTNRRRASPVEFTGYAGSSSPTKIPSLNSPFPSTSSSPPKSQQQQQEQPALPARRVVGNPEPVASTQFVAFNAKSSSSNSSNATGFTNTHGLSSPNVSSKPDLATLGDGVPLSGGKFVPLWKRGLALSRAGSTASSNSAMSTSSSMLSNPSNESMTPKTSSSVESSSKRALPASPTKAPDLRNLPPQNNASQNGATSARPASTVFTSSMNSAEKISAYERSRSRSVSPEKGMSGSGRALPPAPGGNVNAAAPPKNFPVSDATRRNASTTSSNASSSTSHSRAPALSRLDDVSSSSESESDFDHESDTQSISSRADASPQYGIRDLPRVRDRVEAFTGMQQPVPPAMTRGIDLDTNHADAALSNGKTRQGGPRQPPQQSMTLRMAALGLDEASKSASQSSTPSSSTTMVNGSKWTSTTGASNGSWPADVPPLPRARPMSSSSGFNRNIPDTRQVLDLDDAPPVSLRRSPSPGPAQAQYSPSKQPQGRPLPPSSPNVSRALPSQPAYSQSQQRKPLPPTASAHSHHSHHLNANIQSPAPTGGRDTRADIPRISEVHSPGPSINVSGPPSINISQAPTINVSKPPTIQIEGDDDDDDDSFPMINVSEAPSISFSVSEPNTESDTPAVKARPHPSTLPPVKRRGGLVCGGCDGAIIGRIVNAMGARWHPECFRCTQCDTLLEHVSSYEHLGRPYCHLDYHENFAPRCYTCKTAIIEERFISLDDPEMGKRTYHEQHFFCAECGDPFLSPETNSGTTRTGELAVSGDGVFEDDDVGFTVYKGHPYCEACHVRLRLPKCKRCKKSIRDGMQAVEALGGKWCWECFVCAGCEKPFEDPSFFQRHDQPYCESCFSIILKNDL